MLKQGPDFHFEISGNSKISEFEITRFDCIVLPFCNVDNIRRQGVTSLIFEDFYLSITLRERLFFP